QTQTSALVPYTTLFRSNYSKTKALMYSQPDVWFALMDKLADMTIAYVKAQIDAGARAIQIFDSWVGALSAEDYRYYIKPVMKRRSEEHTSELQSRFELV